MKSKILHIILLLLSGYSLFSQGIKINSATNFVVAGAPDIVIKDGGLRLEGIYSTDSETLTFSGTTGDTIVAGSLAVYDLYMTNTGGMIDSSTLLSTNDLTIESGSSFTILPSSSI